MLVRRVAGLMQRRVALLGCRAIRSWREAARAESGRLERLHETMLMRQGLMSWRGIARAGERRLRLRAGALLVLRAGNLLRGSFVGWLDAADWARAERLERHAAGRRAGQREHVAGERQVERKGAGLKGIWSHWMDGGNRSDQLTVLADAGEEDGQSRPGPALDGAPEPEPAGRSEPAPMLEATAALARHIVLPGAAADVQRYVVAPEEREGRDCSGENEQRV